MDRAPASVARMALRLGFSLNSAAAKESPENKDDGDSNHALRPRKWLCTYTVWTTDSSGNYIGSTAHLSGTSIALEPFETSFHQDLNGDGVIDTPTTVIEAAGSIVLTLSHMTQAATIDAGATLELTGADSDQSHSVARQAPWSLTTRPPLPEKY
jgi:hypothetical protein